MKVFLFISALASILSLIWTVLHWNEAAIDSKVLFLWAFVATGFLTCLLYVYSRLRSRVVPELIHLKGACAVTHELNDIVNGLEQDALKNKTVLIILRALSLSASRRLENICSNYPELSDACVKLADPIVPNIELLRTKFSGAFGSVHRVDRKILRIEGLETSVYHPAEPSD